MRIHGVDPRDSRWERHHSAYRVYFWDDAGSSDEYEIADADVPEVLAWAHRTYVLWLRSEDRNDGPGPIRLAGWEQPSDEKPGEGQRPPYATDRPIT